MRAIHLEGGCKITHFWGTESCSNLCLRNPKVEFSCLALYGYMWLSMKLFDFLPPCISLYYTVSLKDCKQPFDTLYDYWLCFCKTLLDTVWLCQNQFHLYWLFLTLFYSVWLNFILSCLVLLKLIILNHVWTGSTVFDSALIFF